MVNKYNSDNLYIATLSKLKPCGVTGIDKPSVFAAKAKISVICIDEDGVYDLDNPNENLYDYKKGEMKYRVSNIHPLFEKKIHKIVSIRSSFVNRIAIKIM